MSDGKERVEDGKIQKRHADKTLETRKCGPCRHDMRPSLTIALPVTADWENLSSKFERCIRYPLDSSQVIKNICLLL